MRLFLSSILLFAFSLLLADQSGIPIVTDNFSRDDLIRSDYNKRYATNEASDKFDVFQTFTVGFSSGSYGSHSSGVYLSTLSYRFDIPLTLSLDIGAYNLFYSSVLSSSWMSPYDVNQPEFLLPRVGLEFKPNDSFSISLQLINRRDAYRAYGYNSRFWRGYYPTKRSMYDEFYYGY